jgi:hypothetical protein
MWQLYNLAKTWNSRPSELINIESDWTAFCLDRAIATFGNALHNELESVEGRNARTVKSKREQILRNWIPEARAQRRFKDPGRKR